MAQEEQHAPKRRQKRRSVAKALSGAARIAEPMPKSPMDAAADPLVAGAATFSKLADPLVGTLLRAQVIMSSYAASLILECLDTQARLTQTADPRALLAEQARLFAKLVHNAQVCQVQVLAAVSDGRTLDGERATAFPQMPVAEVPEQPPSTVVFANARKVNRNTGT